MPAFKTMGLTSRLLEEMAALPVSSAIMLPLRQTVAGEVVVALTLAIKLKTSDAMAAQAAVAAPTGQPQAHLAEQVKLA